MRDLLISGVHLVALVFASWRLTELIVFDKLTEPIRKRFPFYLFTCVRCISVWAGVAAVALYALWPWANWPLALSWLYIAYTDGVQARQVPSVEGRRLLVVMDQSNTMTLVRSELTPPEVDFLITQLKPATEKATAHV